mmetsp:Transcript_130814/g.364588  ORF Transcript_130814/g.364588 Transcript_130814/m.364588 type:complete len:381 (-) Transcript_130814:186-1328(-)|eukprot:CAMPEP_0179082444 /NCGR_PEP_ID=MMETSP0796-20121207/37174_1 /TAXON_ID=73915 /ORGANISM="Pyrodinium bahamense, Strain pbaha01" /LENGTH=380 /DNA_ID=CAMNT_0020779837 /DNA_START=117 /DNA_END=1259 /DNA_ORIENTATION=+
MDLGLGSSPPTAADVRVTGLPPDINEERVRQIFGAYYDVLHCKILANPAPGGASAALLRFESEEAATWVVARLDGGTPQGLAQPVGVSFAAEPAPAHWQAYGWRRPGAVTAERMAAVRPAPYARLPPGGGSCGALAPEAAAGLAAAGGISSCGQVYVSGLPEGIREQEVREVFEPFGTIVQCRILWSLRGQSAALIRFSSDQEAISVVEELNGQVLPELGNVPMVVKFADGGIPKQGWSQRPREFEPKVQGPVKSDPAMGMRMIVKGFEASGSLPGGTWRNDDNALYIDGLPGDCEDIDLYRIFAPFGAIAPKGVRVVKGHGGLCKGYGFVNFLDPAAAQLAIDTINGSMLPDGTIMNVSKKTSPAGNQDNQARPGTEMS